MLNKAFSPLLQISLFNLGYLYVTSQVSLAQVTPDGTVNTQVNQDGNVSEITGGETRGDNLFHSFQEFSVPRNNTAFFNNTNDIANIFSRVTGGNISNINGAIRANGSASLFLINPAGIIFGESAKLDIGGSFYGSTADSILFEDGEFSAVDNLEQPILTVNAPIGLGFRDNPGAIVNRSFAQNSAEEFVGLEVNQGNTLALIGGNINFEAGEATASGGNIYLGGLAEAGIVDLNQDGSLSFPDNVVRGDLIFENAADIDVRGTGGGNIRIDARNLELADGEFGGSQVRAGIRSDSTNFDAEAGDIVIDATEDVILDNILILNQVDSDGIGDAGDILITANSLSAINGGNINTSTSSQGNSGDINIFVNENITLDGVNVNGFSTGIGSFVFPEARGNAGDIEIITNNISLTNGGRIDASTFGEGNAGAVNVDTSGNITADGDSSGIASSVASDAVGDAGGVEVTTSNLSLTNGGRIDTSTFGEGNAGAVNVAASGDITADGDSSGIASSVASDAVGDAGGVFVLTSNLALSNGGQIDASTFGEGNAGTVNLNATGDIIAEGESSSGFSSGITSSVESEAKGNSGGVEVTTSNLALSNGGRIDASTFGEGNAGAVNVAASGDITADGDSSGIASSVASDAVGDAGGVFVLTSNLALSNGGQIDASTFGEGNAGTVNVNATGDIIAEGESSEGFSSGIASQVFESARGNAGGVEVTTSNLSLTNGGRIDASTFGDGNAGAVNVNATGDIIAEGESSSGFSSSIASSVNVDARGNAGGVEVTTSNLSLSNGGRIDASTFGEGDAGAVNVAASEDITADGDSSGIASSVASDAVGDAGGVFVLTSNLALTDGGRIDASTFGQGNAGNINIATDILTINNDGAINASSTNQGNGGSIFVNSDLVGLDNNAQINANSNGEGTGGNILVQASNLTLDGSFISATNRSTRSSISGGDTNLQIAETLSISNNGSISTEAFGNANAGNLTIDARLIGGFQNDVQELFTASEQGNEGNITINADFIFGLNLPFIRSPMVFVEVGNQPENIVESEQTVAQACQANRVATATGSLSIQGKGGVPPEPGLPLSSSEITVNGERNNRSAIPQSIETSQGKIQPARGIKVTESGGIILTAYRTNNSGERLPETKQNCS